MVDWLIIGDFDTSRARGPANSFMHMYTGKYVCRYVCVCIKILILTNISVYTIRLFILRELAITIAKASI